MEFVPDRKTLMKCVLKIEGLTDSSEVRILRVDIHDTVPIHTNNTSKVVKAHIEYEVSAGKPKAAALAIKVPFLRTKCVYECGVSLRFYDKEAQFYRSLVPRLQTLLHADLAPPLLAADEQQTLFMEDLSTRGYRVQVDGRLDAEHSRVALRHLARMHAATYALDREEPRCMDAQMKKQFLFDGEFIGQLYVEVKPVIAALARIGCLSAETADRFDAAVQKAKSDIAGNLDSSRFDFSALNHGDLKAHNILFKHDQQGKPIQCKFIDFQICYWTSPALDIIYFAIQSMDRQVFASNFDSLLHSYATTLNSTLEKFNYDVRMTEAQLKRDIDSVKAFKISTFLFRTTIDIREFSKDFEYIKYNMTEASPELIDELAQSTEIQENVRFWLDEFEKSEVV